jgi:hypothetical protein
MEKTAFFSGSISKTESEKLFFSALHLKMEIWHRLADNIIPKLSTSVYI